MHMHIHTHIHFLAAAQYNHIGDVIAYTINNANEFHRGSPTTFVQILLKVKDAELSWTNHKSEHRITARSCPPKGEFSYDSRYNTFIKERFAQYWTKWAYYDASKVVWHFIHDKFGDAQWQIIQDNIGEVALFNHRNFPPSYELLQMLHSFVLALKPFCETTSTDFLMATFMEFTNCCMTTKSCGPT